MFKKLSAILGGGASVDTVLASPRTQPGGLLAGEVRITGGGAALNVERVELELVANVGHGTVLAFHQLHIGHWLTVAEGASRAIPFELVLPWETH